MNKKIYIFKVVLILLFIGICIKWITIPVNASVKPRNINYQNTHEKVQEYLVNNKINGIVLINGRKNNTPKAINNTIPNNNAQQIINEKRYFPIASLQKLVTGIAISKLVMQHKLSWNTHLNKYFPNVKYASHITIWDLMCHQSGIVDTGDIPSQVLYSESKRENYSLNNFRSTQNKNWNYASSNYCILAAIIRKITGENYYTYIKKKVLFPNNIEQVKPFSEVSNSRDLVLPNHEVTRKKELVKAIITEQLQMNEALLPHKLIFLTNAVYQLMTNNLVNLYIKYNLEIACSNVLGAGDMVSTPLAYWTFVNKLMLEQSIFYKSFLQQAKRTQVGYFGGIYFRKNYICASGNIGRYNCCCFAANYKSKKMLMFFTNNMDYQKLKRVQRDLYSIYFRQNFFE